MKPARLLLVLLLLAGCASRQPVERNLGEAPTTSILLDELAPCRDSAALAAFAERYHLCSQPFPMVMNEWTQCDLQHGSGIYHIAHTVFWTAQGMEHTYALDTDDSTLFAAEQAALLARGFVQHREAPRPVPFKTSFFLKRGSPLRPKLIHDPDGSTYGLRWRFILRVTEKKR